MPVPPKNTFSLCPSEMTGNWLMVVELKDTACKWHIIHTNMLCNYVSVISNHMTVTWEEWWWQHHGYVVILGTLFLQTYARGKVWNCSRIFSPCCIEITPKLQNCIFRGLRVEHCIVCFFWKFFWKKNRPVCSASVHCCSLTLMLE